MNLKLNHTLCLSCGSEYCYHYGVIKITLISFHTLCSAICNLKLIELRVYLPKEQALNNDRLNNDTLYSFFFRSSLWCHIGPWLSAARFKRQKGTLNNDTLPFKTFKKLRKKNNSGSEYSNKKIVQRWIKSTNLFRHWIIQGPKLVRWKAWVGRNALSKHIFLKLPYWRMVQKRLGRLHKAI